MKKTELMLALDFTEKAVAEKWIETFSDQPVIYKVGLELFLSAGPVWVADQVKKGHRIFLDLKLYDIPNTVAQSVAIACDLGVDFLTLHLGGGEEMLSKSLEKVAEKRSKMMILGVSVLTSFSNEQWGHLMKSYGSDSVSIDESIKNLSRLAKRTGVPGMVSSALDLVKVKENYPEVYSVTPGIRFESTGRQDQKRVVSPREARALGSSAIVMGRPVFLSENPLETVETILKDLT
jgi:orotidine-5'-phosphate decarboxylase